MERVVKEKNLLTEIEQSLIEKQEKSRNINLDAIKKDFNKIRKLNPHFTFIKTHVLE